MGYQSITIEAGTYHLYTATFKNIGTTSQIDLKSIVPVTATGATYTGNNRIKIQKLAANGDYGATYNYRNSKGGWCQASTLLDDGAVMLSDGEAICVYNGETANVQLRFSGEVNLRPMSVLLPPQTYALVGNMTPVAIDLKGVQLLNADQESFTSNNRVKVQKLLSNGDYGPTYNYRTSKGGWCQASTLLDDGAVMLQAGESMCVYNGESSTSVYLLFPSPIQ